MKRLLASLLAAALLVALLPQSSTTKNTLARLSESVRPLQVEGSEFSNYVEETTGIRLGLEPGLYNTCTTSYINSQKHYWLTAAHCITRSLTYYVDGEPAHVIMRDIGNDLAILSTEGPTDLITLRLARHGPQACTQLDPEKECRIMMSGYPFGLMGTDSSPFFVTGTIMQPEAIIPFIAMTQGFMVFHIPGAPGNSGSPVTNGKGELVSVLQITLSGRLFGSVMGGVPFKTLEKYRSYFKEN